MRMDISKEGVLHLDLFDIETQEDEQKFIYYYLGLSYDTKKKFENAYYNLYIKGLLAEPEAQIIHTDINNITYIEVHPNDILKNISMIKRISAGDVVDKLESEAKPHLVVVEDENE